MALEPNREIFDEAQGLINAADDPDLYIDVLQIFMEDVKQDEKKLGEYLAAGDLEKYEIIVHALKNNLRTLGAGKAGEAAYDMELHCKSGDLEYVKIHHDELLEAIAAAKKYIRQYMWDRV